MTGKLSKSEMRPNVVCVLLSFYFMMVLFVSISVKGECCETEWWQPNGKKADYYCNDGSSGTFLFGCCGKGSCNLWCCNCDNGCK